jgi:hypothetical protein
LVVSLNDLAFNFSIEILTRSAIAPSFVSTVLAPCAAAYAKVVFIDSFCSSVNLS